jgi:hypothetical protein
VKGVSDSVGSFKREIQEFNAELVGAIRFLEGNESLGVDKRGAYSKDGEERSENHRIGAGWGESYGRNAIQVA